MSGIGAATLVHSVTLFGAGADVADRADGWALFVDGRVRAVGAGPWAEAAATVGPLTVVDGREVAGAGAVLSPGLVDIHVHGGGGHAFEEGVDAIAAAAALHRRAGTTRIIASLVSAPVDALLRQLDAVSQAQAAAPGLLGAHLEGPFLSPEHRGAHDPSALAAPASDALTALLGTGAVRQVTIAPELPGAIDAIRQITAAGAQVAIGHTHADGDEAREAFDAGARLVTHAFNAMRPLHHRAPGVVGAALADPRVVLEAIPDGHHLHGDTVRLLFAAAPGRVALITDAMAAAGCEDGPYRLGSLDVEVRDGAARLQGSDTIAGSTLTLAEGVRRAHALGLPLRDVLTAATAVPARALGLADVGSLTPGSVADAVLWDSGLAVRSVWQDGERV